jgi:trans-2,3-dihydro-3-hydroxyanthranilate isomerase
MPTVGVLQYEVVDVFTDRPFAGNPLAVVFDADRLEPTQMQALATEFNLSETIFVLKPNSPDATYRVRIFTAERELPFAGHPSVGVAVTQHRAGLIPAGRVVQECGAGLLPIDIDPAGAATLHGGAPVIGPEIDAGPLLAAVGLTTDDHVGPAPRIAGCGLEFPYLCVRPESLARASGQGTVARAHDLFAVFVFVWDAANRSARVRVFFGSQMVEDPATGSAALGFGVYAVGAGLLPGDGETEYMIRQGVERGRPSTLTCTVSASGGRAVATTVTGSVVPVARGETAVPTAPKPTSIPTSERR